MAVLIFGSGAQTFIDSAAVGRMVAASHTVKLAHRGSMQNQYTLTMAYHDGGEDHETSCDIVTNVPSDSDDILRMSSKEKHDGRD